MVARKHLLALGVQLVLIVILAVGISVLGGSKASVIPELIWISAGSIVVNAYVPALLAQYRKIGSMIADQIAILIVIEGISSLASPYHSIAGDALVMLVVSMPLFFFAFVGYGVGVGVVIRDRRDLMEGP